MALDLAENIAPYIGEDDIQINYFGGIENYDSIIQFIGGDEFLNDESQNINEELINNFMNQIMDSAWVEEDLKKTVAPSYFLKKSDKEYWLMNTQLKR